MHSKPYATFEEATKAEENYKEFDTVYSRPNPNKEEGGYVVIYFNTPWFNKPLWGGCPRNR